MSWHASSWASWYSEARLSDRLVMFVIAHHVSDEGEAHPSIDTICKETRLGRSTVIDCIYNLARIGELAIKRGGQFRGNSNSYTLPKFNLWVQSLNPKTSVTVRKASDKRPLRVQSTPHRIVGELDTGYKPATYLSDEYFSHPKYGEIRRKRYEAERADRQRRSA